MYINKRKLINASVQRGESRGAPDYTPTKWKWFEFLKSQEDIEILTYLLCDICFLLDGRYAYLCI